MHEGWIKLYRKVLESEVAGDLEMLGLWCWCLLKANHKDKKWKGRNIEAGRFFTGRNEASRELGVPASSFRYRMKKLEQWGYISQKADNQGTMVTICNWTTYQNQGSEVEQRVDNGLTTGCHRIDTNKKERSKEGENKNSSSQDIQTAEWMFGLIQENYPSASEPDFLRWANTIRLMRTRDGRSDDEIRELFRWASQDNFWSLNIRSPDKLRQKWEDLDVRRLKNGQPRKQRLPDAEDLANWTPE